VLAPANYLSNIFQSLCRFNVVRAHRGARRGYSLARPPEEITLLEIVEALEGPVALTCCTADPVPSCPFSPDCHVTEVFRDLQRVMVERLSSTTLAQVARRGGGHGDP
jgi:Rrf2 family protein